MINTSTVICSYHRTLNTNDSWLIKKFASANLDNFQVLFDNQNNYSEQYVSDVYKSNICLYNDSDFIKYKFNKPIDRNHRWGNHQNPKYFYAHFRMMVFYLKNPTFDYYWFFDDDVDFSGNLKKFLDQYNHQNEDFLAIQVFKKEDYKEFPKISIINNRMSGSHGNWLGWCPGPGDNFKNINRHLGSFFPIVRFSNRAMGHLFNLHTQGHYGYSEGFVPTSLASDGYSVASMMDEFNNFFISNISECQLLHKNIPFTWEWL